MKTLTVLGLVSAFLQFNLNFFFFNLSVSESGKWDRSHLRRNGLLLLLLQLALLLQGSLLVPHLVLRQVVRPDEPAAADGAAELFLAGVGPPVPGQLVRPGKSSAASLDLAFVRAFTCVDAIVGLEVGRLKVGLVAVWKVADERPFAVSGQVRLPGQAEPHLGAGGLRNREAEGWLLLLLLLLLWYLTIWKDFWAKV